MGIGSIKNGVGNPFALRQCGLQILDVEKLLLELGIVLLMVHLYSQLLQNWKDAKNNWNPGVETTLVICKEALSIQRISYGGQKRLQPNLESMRRLIGWKGSWIFYMIRKKRCGINCGHKGGGESPPSFYNGLGTIYIASSRERTFWSYY